MDIKIERALVYSCINAIELQYVKETIKIEKEWLGGLVDRLYEAIGVEDTHEVNTRGGT